MAITHRSTSLPSAARACDRRRRRSPAWLLAALSVLGAPQPAAAQDSTRPTNSRKTLSVDALLNLEVISVSKREERLFDAAASIYVIGADDIRRSGATTLAEVLRLAPNLNVARVDSVQYAISARGFNNAVGNKLLVLIDGRTVYTPLFSGVFWDQQDVLLSDIERIEVISGPGATLWGANAVNGVINVITKPATETQGAAVAATIGSADREIAARWGGTLESLSYRAYAKVAGIDRTIRADGSDVPNEWRKGQLGARMDWGGARDTLTIQGDAYAGESEHRGFVGSIELPEVEVGGANVLAHWTRHLDGDANLQIQAYFDHAHRDDFIIFRPDANLFDIEVQHGFPLGSHRLLWGGGYRHGRDHVEPSIFATFIPAERRLNWENVFVQGDLRLTERLGATIGTKLENNDYSGLEHLPSVRLTWKASDTHFLWGAVSRAVRAPSRLDREVFYPMEPPYAIIGGPNFESEVANVFETGYRGRASESVSYSLTAFLHDWDKLRSATALPVELENKIYGTVYGVEAWATYQPFAVWTLSAGSTLLNMDLRLRPGSGDPVGTNNPTLRNDPDYTWTLRSSVDLRGNLELDVYARGVGALPNPSVPAYTEMDVRIGWRPLPTLEVAVNGRDLLHESHAEFGELPGRSDIRRRASFGATWTF